MSDAPDKRIRELREREIVQLQRMIEADQALGCLKGIVGYFGMAILFTVVAGVLGAVMESIGLAVSIYTAGLLSYVIYWTILRSRRQKKKDKLNQLLKEEQQDIERDKQS